MIKNIRGIEGDDIPYHLSLLGYDASTMISDRYYFFPLNDHYNTHGPEWLAETTVIAQSKEVVVFYDLVNTGDYEHNKFKQFIWNFEHPCKVYLTVNQSTKLDMGPTVKIVQWDFMWNRIKAYYTEEVPSETLHLHHYSRGKYKSVRLDSSYLRSKKFLSMLGREYGYRKPYYEFILNHSYNGYVSNRSRNITLEQEMVMGAYTPVPNSFYEDSYFSTYVESNCTQKDLIHITEKTFEPLIKGHAILPFTNPGAIQRLLDMGFRLVDFIDYSFDRVEDADQRFALVQQEFLKLLDLDLDTLYKHNQSVFKHNHDCVNTIPYDNRILEVFNV
jgi:hypothetical protein